MFALLPYLLLNFYGLERPSCQIDHSVRICSLYWDALTRTPITPHKLWHATSNAMPHEFDLFQTTVIDSALAEAVTASLSRTEWVDSEPLSGARLSIIVTRNGSPDTLSFSNENISQWNAVTSKTIDTLLLHRVAGHLPRSHRCRIQLMQGVGDCVKRNSPPRRPSSRDRHRR